MKRLYLFIYFLATSLCLFATYSCSCSGPEKKLDAFQMLQKFKELDSSVEVIYPKSINDTLVKCSDFKPPCISGHLVKIKELEFTALYYESLEEAKKSARFIDGYRFKNWVFDQVRGEPILERFFQQKLKATHNPY